MMNTGAARKQCPELITVMVPTAHGKANMAVYKEAGRPREVLSDFAEKVEKGPSMRSPNRRHARSQGPARGDAPSPIFEKRPSPGSHQADSAATLSSAREPVANRRLESAEGAIGASAGGASYDQEAACSCRGPRGPARRATIGWGFPAATASRRRSNWPSSAAASASRTSRRSCSRGTSTVAAGPALGRLQGLGGKEGKQLISRLGITTAGELGH